MREIPKNTFHSPLRTLAHSPTGRRPHHWSTCILLGLCSSVTLSDQPSVPCLKASVLKVFLFLN